MLAIYSFLRKQGAFTENNVNRHFDRPSQRRIMRSYGVIFRYRKEEVNEEEEEKEDENLT